jgi:hypothetical protein
MLIRPSDRLKCRKSLLYTEHLVIVFGQRVKNANFTALLSLAPINLLPINLHGPHRDYFKYICEFDNFGTI